MFLHKYKDESGTFYGLTASKSPGDVKLSASTVGKNSIPAERVSNFIKNIDMAFREKPEKEEEVKKEKKKKSSISDMIRNFTFKYNGE